MSKKMAGILITFGFGLGALGFLVLKLAPALEQVTFFAGSIGGGLCVLWGVAALAGLKGRVWASLSVIATALVLLSQVIHVWSVPNPETGGPLIIRALVTLMLVLTVGMLMYLLHGERPSEFYSRGTKALK